MSSKIDAKIGLEKSRFKRRPIRIKYVGGVAGGIVRGVVNYPPGVRYVLQFKEK